MSKGFSLDTKLCELYRASCRFAADWERMTVLDVVGSVVGVLAVIFVLWKVFKGAGAHNVGGDRSARPNRSSGNELGSSDLATKPQIKHWLQPTGKDDTYLTCSELRGSGGKKFGSGKIYIPGDQRNRHILFVAKTGGGKTTKAILPILYNDCLDPNRSTIVIDSKPEMWSKLGMMTRMHNPKKKLLLFNPLDISRSMSWNIVGKVENDTDAKLIANTIIMATDVPGSRQDSPFFRNNALQLLNAMMVGLLNDPSDRLSMPRVHELVHSGKLALCDWLEAHPHALRNSRTFVELARSGSQNADTVLSELGMRMSAWDLHDIRATTSLEELDLEALIAEPTLLVIELRESEIEMLRPMANTIVIEVLRYLTKRAETFTGGRLPRPVSIVIDEFSSALGRLPDIHVKLNTLRSRNVSIVAAIQSIAQIKANYQNDADSVLAGFSTKVLMPPLDVVDAEWASKETGTMTIRYKTESSGSSRKIIENFANRNRGIQEQVQQRAVLTPDEIGRPVDNIETFFFPNTPVFQGRLIPWYQIPEMRDRISKYDKAGQELQIRSGAIYFEEELPTAPPPTQAAGGESSGSSQDLRELLDQIKKKLDWENTTGVAREWWEAFETQNQSNLAAVLLLAQELLGRQATITEFFLAYVYSNSDSCEENLKYLDQMREQQKSGPSTPMT